VQSSIRPFLWMNDQAQEAARFYTSIFKNSRVIESSKYVTTFELDGRLFMARNVFEDKQTSAAFYVDCDTQEEIDRLWDRLSEDAETGVCGWLTDKYGVNWNIVPSILGDLMMDEDPNTSGRVFQAMLDMKKLDIAGLQAAAAGPQQD
jgi:predicted 3-demethylubiquinone-9 3-methyltransferase (glyoxalase superfamily)